MRKQYKFISKEKNDAIRDIMEIEISEIPEWYDRLLGKEEIRYIAKFKGIATTWYTWPDEVRCSDELCAILGDIWNREEQRKLEEATDEFDKELLEIDQKLGQFYQNQLDIPETLKLLARYQKPAAGSELAVMLEEITKHRITIKLLIWLALSDVY